MKEKESKSVKQIPYHIQYAIEHEEACIKYRERQIEGYKKKIELFKKGVKMGEVLKQCPALCNSPQYSYKKYNELKENWEKKFNKDKD